MGDTKKPGCLENLLAAVLLIVLVGWGIKSCGNHVLAPETPEQAGKQKQEEAVKAEKWKQEEVKQPKRKKLIQDLVSQGIFKKVEFRDKDATVWVGAAFYLLDFEAKQNFCSVVHAYMATYAKDDLVGVTLKDVQSGKAVGEYGQQWTGGVGLKMK